MHIAKHKVRWYYIEVRYLTICKLKGADEMKKFNITVFMSEVQDLDEGGQQVYDFLEQYEDRYTVRDVAQEIQKSKFITFPHAKGNGITLINIDHVSEIAINEFDDEYKEWLGSIDNNEEEEEA